MGRSKQTNRYIKKTSVTGEKEKRKVGERILKVLREKAQSSQGAIIVNDNISMSENRRRRRSESDTDSESESSPEYATQPPRKRTHQTLRLRRNDRKKRAVSQHVKSAHSHLNKESRAQCGKSGSWKHVLGGRITENRLTMQRAGMFLAGRRSEKVIRAIPRTDVLKEIADENNTLEPFSSSDEESPETETATFSQEVPYEETAAQLRKFIPTNPNHDPASEILGRLRHTYRQMRGQQFGETSPSPNDDGEEDAANNNPHPVDNHHTSAPTSRSDELFLPPTDNSSSATHMGSRLDESFPSQTDTPLHFPLLTSSSVPDNRQESEEDDVLIVSEDEDFIDADTVSEDDGLTHDEIPSWGLGRQQEELGQGLTPNDSAMRMLTQNSFLSRVSSLCVSTQKQEMAVSRQRTIWNYINGYDTEASYGSFQAEDNLELYRQAVAGAAAAYYPYCPYYYTSYFNVNDLMYSLPGSSSSNSSQPLDLTVPLDLTISTNSSSGSSFLDNAGRQNASSDDDNQTMVRDHLPSDNRPQHCHPWERPTPVEGLDAISDDDIEIHVVDDSPELPQHRNPWERLPPVEGQDATSDDDIEIHVVDDSPELPQHRNPWQGLPPVPRPCLDSPSPRRKFSPHKLP